MALIKCADCGKDISDLAPSCPNCGRPRELANTTIEQTSKKLKGQLVYAYIVFILGLLILGSAFFNGTYQGINFGIAVAAGGFLWIIVTKIQIWWHHE